MDPLLLLLVLGDLLGPNDAVQLVDLVDMSRFLVVKMLVESRHRVLHIYGELLFTSSTLTAYRRAHLSVSIARISSCTF